MHKYRSHDATFVYTSDKKRHRTRLDHGECHSDKSCRNLPKFR